MTANTPEVPMPEAEALSSVQIEQVREIFTLRSKHFLNEARNDLLGKLCDMALRTAEAERALSAAQKELKKWQLAPEYESCQAALAEAERRNERLLEALQELVRLEDLKEQTDDLHTALLLMYEAAKPGTWQAARAALKESSSGAELI